MKQSVCDLDYLLRGRTMYEALRIKRFTSIDAFQNCLFPLLTLRNMNYGAQPSPPKDLCPSYQQLPTFSYNLSAISTLHCRFVSVVVRVKFYPTNQNDDAS
jgi:hypothetical protein